jgi:hypothetical protein
VLKLFAEILDSELVLEPRQETKETETTSIPKPVTEDVLLTTITSSNAESMADQTKMIRVLWPMLDAQANHGYHHISELVKSTELLEKDGFIFTTRVSGDHSLPTTSGITTTVPKLFVKASAMVRV